MSTSLLPSKIGFEVLQIAKPSRMRGRALLAASELSPAVQSHVVYYCQTLLLRHLPVRFVLQYLRLRIQVYSALPWSIRASF